MQRLCFLTASLFALAVAFASPAEDKKADAEKIQKLVEQLSSKRFAERERAQKALEEIGLPALDALKKAAESGDMETRKRAAELVEKLLKKVETGKALTPTRVRLTFKDTPLKDALAEIKKKTGYDIQLLDPQNKLKDRKVTLDTGEVTFWEAFDQFCDKAGLTEASINDLYQNPNVLPGIEVPVQPLPVKPVRPIRIQPVRPAQPAKPAVQPLPAGKPAGNAVQPQKPAVQEKPAEQAVEKKVEEKAAPKKEEQKQQAPQAQVRARAAKAQVQVQVQGQALPAKVQIQVAPVQGPPVQILPVPPNAGGGFGGMPGPAFPVDPNAILVKDGKASRTPTSYAGAVRVRALKDSANHFGGAPEKQLLIGLQISPEPRIKWQRTVAVRIDKAIDDQNQSLTPAMGDGNVHPNVGLDIPVKGVVDRPVVWGGGWQNGLHHLYPVRLNKGEKTSREIKELKGTITGEVLGTPETLITVDDVLKAKGKEIKGNKGGQIKISNIVERDGTITIHCQLEQPEGFVPAGQNMPFGGGFGGPVKILPAQGQVQVIQIANGQVMVGGGAVGFDSGYGLKLLDDKGNLVPFLGVGFTGRFVPNGKNVPEMHLTYRPNKDQKPAKLVYQGSKIMSVEVPFTLKNVPVK